MIGFVETKLTVGGPSDEALKDFLVGNDLRHGWQGRETQRKNGHNHLMTAAKKSGFGGTERKNTGGQTISKQIDWMTLIPKIIVDRKEKDGSLLKDIVAEVMERTGLVGEKERKRIRKNLRKKLSRDKGKYRPWVQEKIDIVRGDERGRSQNCANKTIKWSSVKLKIKIKT